MRREVGVGVLKKTKDKRQAVQFLDNERNKKQEARGKSGIFISILHPGLWIVGCVVCYTYR